MGGACVVRAWYMCGTSQIKAWGKRWSGQETGRNSLVIPLDSLGCAGWTPGACDCGGKDALHGVLPSVGEVRDAVERVLTRGGTLRGVNWLVGWPWICFV